MLVGVSKFDDVVERRDTETEKERVGGGVVFLGCTLGEGEKYLEEVFCLFPPRVMIEKRKKKGENGVNRVKVRSNQSGSGGGSDSEN